MDKNGYNPSILQADHSRCYICGSRNQKLDRHEVFGGAYREKSKRHGLWVSICHDRCHLNGVHKFNTMALTLKQDAQLKAMCKLDWTTPKFIVEFGKNYLTDFIGDNTNA